MSAHEMLQRKEQTRAEIDNLLRITNPKQFYTRYLGITDSCVYVHPVQNLYAWPLEHQVPASIASINVRKDKPEGNERKDWAVAHSSGLSYGQMRHGPNLSGDNIIALAGLGGLGLAKYNYTLNSISCSPPELENFAGPNGAQEQFKSITLHY